MNRLSPQYLLRMLLVITACLVAGCGADAPVTVPAIYYWRTEFAPDSLTRVHLEVNGIRVLYVRFFDVEWSEAGGQPMPTGQIHFSRAPDEGWIIVPVVYITVEALRRLDLADVPDIASKVLSQVDSISSRSGISFKEFQLDCDWTPSTREKFFTFASIIRGRLHARDVLLSATVRLHQVKYPDRTGIPPVDRGMLMFYNMGRISAAPGENSIFDEAITRRYTDYIDTYPLALDIALPIFHWTLHFRGGHPVGIINKFSDADLSAHPELLRGEHGQFTAVRHVWLHGESVLPGDVLRSEEVPPDLCLRAAKLASAELPPAQRRIALFEADSVYLSHYEISDIDAVFRAFK
ncbi:MAG: hypothetical protein HY962_00855 [Ignavibacteriae bacterium]|nr:hypothetical protein [Ignavibacteriota bacterium]